MKAIIVCILSCLSAFAADTSDIRVATRTYKITPEDSLGTEETFTRDGQTNLVRDTHTKDGVVIYRSQSFYYNGAQAGIYLYNTANGTNTVVGSTPGTPYYFAVHFDASNKPRSAQIHATNLVMLDWFLCTNGIFYPADGSLIRKANAKLKKDFPPH
jgi:hypothetical protein